MTTTSRKRTAATPVDDPSELPTGPDYAYHVVPVEDADAVLTEGLDPAKSPDKWDAFDRILERVADEEGVTPKPENRSECSFAYTNLTPGTNPTVHLSGYATLALDVTVIDAPLYAASYGAATGAHTAIAEEHPEWRSDHGPVPDNLAPAAYEAAVEYWESLVEYDPTTPVSDQPGELLVDGGVPTAAITHHLDDMEDEP